MSDKIPEPLAQIELGPADRLVLVYPKTLTRADGEYISKTLKAKGWGDRVLIVAGVEELAVLRAGVQS